MLAHLLRHGCTTGDARFESGALKNGLEPRFQPGGSMFMRVVSRSIGADLSGHQLTASCTSQTHSTDQHESQA